MWNIINQRERGKHSSSHKTGALLRHGLDTQVVSQVLEVTVGQWFGEYVHGVVCRANM